MRLLYVYLVQFCTQKVCGKLPKTAGVTTIAKRAIAPATYSTGGPAGYASNASKFGIQKEKMVGSNADAGGVYRFFFLGANAHVPVLFLVKYRMKQRAHSNYAPTNHPIDIELVQRVPY